MEKLFNNTKAYHHNDVLCGRGRYIRDHPGNRQFISLIKELKSEYVTAQKKKKPMYADLVVKKIRSMDPPGRFLKRCHITRQWVDIGDRQATAKARQALREGAPEIIKHLETRTSMTKDKADISAKTKAPTWSVEQPVDLCEPNTENEETLVSPVTSSLLRDISSSNHKPPDAQIQPIPLHESIGPVTTSRDDAYTLLRILTSPESPVHSPTATFLSHGEMGEIDENINDVQRQQLQHLHPWDSQLLANYHASLPEKVSMLSNTMGYHHWMDSSWSCFRSPNQYSMYASFGMSRQIFNVVSTGENRMTDYTLGNSDHDSEVCPGIPLDGEELQGRKDLDRSGSS